MYIIDEQIAKIYGHFKAEIIDYFGPKEKTKRRKFRINQVGISDNDLWITATAIKEKLIIVSKDKDFLRIKEVQNFDLESWI